MSFPGGAVCKPASGGTAISYRRGGQTISWLAMLLALPASALAGPQGGQVQQGDATISVSGSQTTIDQRTNKAIINWHSFGIDSNESAVFNQPGSNAIALNRVTGSDPSNILGALRSNGQVWLVNRNGVMFGKSATVDVHGLVATTADIPDSKFCADDYKFSIPSTVPNAGVTNEGTISFGERGLAALVGSNVRNSGVIAGRLGSVVIAGAPTFTIDLDPRDGGLIQFAATSKVTSALAGQPLVENTGEIRNDGGLIRITASAADGIVDEAINTSGLIEANSLALQDGRIELVNNTAGRVVVDGQLAASSVDLFAGKTMLIDGTILSSDSTTLDAEHLTIGGNVTSDGDVRLRGKSIATVGEGEVTAKRLDVASKASPHHPAGGGTLSLKTNVDEIAIGKTQADKTHFREATVVNDGDLIISQIDSSGIDVGQFNLQMDGTLSINRPIVATASGDAVVIVTGRFVNGVGADALQTPQGRALVYSTDPNIDDRGGLDGSLLFDKNFADAPPGTIGIPGNVFIYSSDPSSPAPAPSPEPGPAPAPAQQPQLNAFQIAQVTQPTVVPASDVAETAITAESRLIRLPSTSTNEDDSENTDLLFANDGNRELWGVSGGR